MKTLIVGGNFGDTPKNSKILDLINKNLNGDIINGGSFNDLQSISMKVHQYDFVIWMPNISNEFEELKIMKKPGSTMFVSKQIGEKRERNRVDAVTRIFKFGANAVLAINIDDKPFKFTLIDALDNDWYDGYDINELVIQMNILHEWSSTSIRKGTTRKVDDIDRLIELNKKVADVSHNQGIRYFGNLSTRCTKMFPSIRLEDSILVSPRNSDKNRLKRNDLVNVSNELKYRGLNKPSVDTPVQVELYKLFPKINFFIHGHRQIKDIKTTEHYFPCGDLREVPEIEKLMKNQNYGSINLKNHGFLLFSDTIDNLKELVDKIEFYYKNTL